MAKQNGSLDVNAKTVEEAIETGLAQLGLSREQVDIEILNEGKRGLFGLGAEEAIVRLTVKQEPTAQLLPKPEPVIEESSNLATTRPDEDFDEDEGFSGKNFSPANADEENELTQLATGYLQNLLKLMGIQANVVTRMGTDLVEPGETPPLVLDIIGNDLGILIGRRSETLQALQYVVRLMVSKELEQWPHLVVDVESYRARRRDSLYKMANRMADRATSNNERVVLEAMTAYERRIIHIALRDHPKVYTKSIGRDTNRKVTIIPK